MTTPRDSTIRRIASWGAGTAVASLYLDVDGMRHPRWPDVEQRADHLFRSARQRAVAEMPGDEAAVEADLAEIRAWLNRGVDRATTRGVALFSDATKDLFESVELAVPVRDQVVVDREPDIAQLCVADATSWSAIAVAVDAERWRVVRMERDGRVHELDALDDTRPRTVDTGTELAGFGRHEEERAREHFRRVARSLGAQMRRRPARHVVLLGTDDAVEALAGYLPRHVADRVAGSASVPGHAETDDLAAAAREVVERAEKERQAAVVATLRARAATGTSVVAGLAPTLDALGAGMVATLVVERTFEAPGGRCRECHLLVTGADRCPHCGGAVRAIENVVDAAVSDAFLGHETLEPVEDGSLHDLGRIGALTRRRAVTTDGAGSA